MSEKPISKYLTQISSAQLRPIHIYQAAVTDLRLLARKAESKAYDEEPYSFMSRHVHRARTIEHLIALAYFEPLLDSEGNLRTNKDSTHRIYGAVECLRLALGHMVLFRADEHALRKVELPHE